MEKMVNIFKKFSMVCNVSKKNIAPKSKKFRNLKKNL